MSRTRAYLRWELPGLLSLVAFLSITAFLFRSSEFALMVTASLGFHELGHAVALAWYGLPYRISFGIVGAWTWSDAAERKKLPQLSNTWIHLAGPLFSLLFAVIALVLNALWKPSSPYLLMLANFSAEVGFFNLLPLGNFTDGGKALHRMMLTLSGKPGRLNVLALPALALLAPSLYQLFHPASPGQDLMVRLAGFILIGAWLAASVLAELRKSGPPQLEGAQPMSVSQMTFTMLCLWNFLAVLFLVMIATPFWLAPQYMVGMLDNMKVVLGWIASWVT